MAYKVVLLFLALMLFVGACRSQEMVGDEDAFNALRDLMLRESRGTSSRNAQVLCVITSKTICYCDEKGRNPFCVPRK